MNQKNTSEEIDDIREAYNRIRPYINKTPVFTSRTLNAVTGAEIYIKCENFQRGGAFKCRGAFNTLLQLTEEEKKRGVITHSSGNHAQAVALAANVLGIDATIVMPQNAPVIKKNATAGYGAKIVVSGNHPMDRQKKAEELAQKNGSRLMHSYNEKTIIQGAGTAALELIEEVGYLDIVLAPVGGGGLLSGTSLSAKNLLPQSKVFGIEPEQANDAYKSFKDGTRIFPSDNPRTIADGLRTALGDKTFAVIKKNVDDIILVSEQEILEAMRFLWERMKIVVEPSGAVSVAGLLKLKKEKRIDLENLKVGAIISGGNIDLNDFFASLEKRLEHD